MSSPHSHHVGEPSSSRGPRRNGNGNGSDNSNSSRRRRRRRRPPSPPPPPPPHHYDEAASTSRNEVNNGGVWPEPFVEALAVQLANDHASGLGLGQGGRLAVAPALALLFQVLFSFLS